MNPTARATGRWLRSLALAAALALPFGPDAGAEATGGSSPAGYRALIGRLVDDKAAIERILDELAVPPHLRRVFARHLVELFRSDVVVEALARELSFSEPLLLSEPADAARALAQQFGAAWAQEKITAGIEHLPVEDQRRFLALAGATLARMPPADCAAMVRGTASAVVMARAEMTAMAAMPAEKVAPYLALSRRAIVAELSDHPVVVPLGTTELAFANRAFEAAVDRALAAHPDGAALTAAALAWDGAQEGAQDGALCELTLLTIEAGLSVRGTVGDWVIRMLNAE